MKRNSSLLYTLLSLSLCAALMAGCKKDKASNPAGGGDYYIRFKVNNTAVDYRALTESQIARAGNQDFYICTLLAGKDASTPTKNILSIAINNNTTITQGTEYNLIKTINIPNIGVTTQGYITYIDNDATGYAALGTAVSALSPDMAAKVTITELAAGYMKGTFSATAYRAADLATKVAITDGEFYLKRVQ